MLVSLLLGLAAGLATLLLVVGLGRSARGRDPVLARLEALASTEVRSIEEQELSLPFFERALRPLINRLSRKVKRGGSNVKANRIDRRLAMAGLSNQFRASEWAGLRIITTACGGLGFLLLGIPLLGDPVAALTAGVVGVGIGRIGPAFWLGKKVKARQTAILLQLPDALDLLTISVRAGLGFDAAIGKVVEKMQGPLIEEFRRALSELRAGMPRRDALRGINARTNCAPLTTFIEAILQAEEYGNSISKTLQVQSEQLRHERRQRAQEAAAKAPIKMLLPLVGCIFPALFIVILGPALIMIMLNFGGGGGPSL